MYRKTLCLPIRLGSVASRFCHRRSFDRRLFDLTSFLSGWRKIGSHRIQRLLPTKISEEVRLQRLEAILFLAKEPLSSRKLSQYANLADGTEARTLVARLNENLDRVGRAFQVQEVAGGFRLGTRSKFASWLRRLEHIPRETRLSGPAMETLAVVAYRQPVVRADVEAIRGVSCVEILRQLMERDFVRINGRSEELGRPYLYSTTKRFLQVFGLRSLEELPRSEILRNKSDMSKSGSTDQQGDLTRVNTQ